MCNLMVQWIQEAHDEALRIVDLPKKFHDLGWSSPHVKIPGLPTYRYDEPPLARWAPLPAAVAAAQPRPATLPELFDAGLQRQRENREAEERVEIVAVIPSQVNVDDNPGEDETAFGADVVDVEEPIDFLGRISTFSFVLFLPC